ncbi:lyase family protein [Actinospica durhamensis]|uniref:lyase family protein n=1 Tax=Actinospica durhamensis TaxID=1508375 RepID=UPI001BAB32F3|nr:lyase family protein [Actinospica durhamensis]
MSTDDTFRTRTEHDSLGAHEVPASAYWGVHTARALTNFPVSGTSVGTHRELVAALGAVKLAAARANHDLGLLDDRRFAAIAAAAQEVIEGALDDQFVVDVIQGGAGTSTNMNANEVIANRALEILGRARGDYAEIHPLDHVNRCQSTNDVYPTAVRLALMTVMERLVRATTALADAFGAKAVEFRTVPKIGRTQLQDAVPMTVGQELGAFAVTLREELPRLEDARALLCEINIGATAIGTGITAHPDYRRRALAHLAEIKRGLGEPRRGRGPQRRPGHRPDTASGLRPLRRNRQGGPRRRRGRPDPGTGDRQPRGRRTRRIAAPGGAREPRSAAGRGRQVTAAARTGGRCARNQGLSRGSRRFVRCKTRYSPCASLVGLWFSGAAIRRCIGGGTFRDDPLSGRSLWNAACGGFLSGRSTLRHGGPIDVEAHLGHLPADPGRIGADIVRLGQRAAGAAG